MFYVYNSTCDDGSENDFTELSTGDNAKHPESLLVSSKSGSESHQIWIVTNITGLQIFNVMIISSVSCKVGLIVGGERGLIRGWVKLKNFTVFVRKTLWKPIFLMPYTYFPTDLLMNI